MSLLKKYFTGSRNIKNWDRLKITAAIFVGHGSGRETVIYSSYGVMLTRQRHALLSQSRHERHHSHRRHHVTSAHLTRRPGRRLRHIRPDCDYRSAVPTAHKDELLTRCHKQLHPLHDVCVQSPNVDRALEKVLLQHRKTNAAALRWDIAACGTYPATIWRQQAA